jgi:hypothetical protein
MKKGFTLLLVALMATTAFAQSPYQTIEEKGNAYVNARQERVINKNVRFANAPSTLAPKHENPTELDPSLFVQPEGELQLMRRSGIDYLPVWGSPAPAEYSEKGTYVVKGTDGNYYFKNFITNMCNGGTWIKGEVEGNVITVKTGQINAQLWYDNGSTNQLYTYYLHALKAEEATGVDWSGNEYTYTVYVPDEEVTEIKFNIEEDGTITSQDPNLLYGGVEEVDGYLSWPGQGDMDCTFYPFDEVPQTAPEGIEYSDFVFTHYPYDSNISYEVIQGAVVDNIFYAKIAKIVPDAVIKATIEGDKARIETNQFLGVDQTYSTLAYLKPCTIEKVVDEWGWATLYTYETEEMILDYDADLCKFNNPDLGLIVNAGKADVSSHEVYLRPTFYLFNEQPATPASPEFTYFLPYTETEYYAHGYAGFNIYTTDVDGNYILPDKLFYTCYLDQTPLVFSVEDYPDLEEDMTVIPYGYSNYDIVGGGSTSRYIYFYTGDFEYFGVQTIYRGGGEERRSPIVYYPEYNPDDTGINEMGTDATVVETTYLDLQGRQHNGLTKGINIVVVKYSDGTSKTAKIMVK